MHADSQPARQAGRQTDIHTYGHTDIHTYIDAYIDAYRHACRNIHTHTIIQTYIPGWWFGIFLVFHRLGIIIPTD